MCRASLKDFFPLTSFCVTECEEILFSVSGCGGDLTDSEGSFSSPNHPGSYPSNSLCVWVIRVPSPYLIQIHVSSLNVEGPSPCLFDWLEVQEHVEQSSVITRLVTELNGHNTCRHSFRAFYTMDMSLMAVGQTSIVGPMFCCCCKKLDLELKGKLCEV